MTWWLVSTTAVIAWVAINSVIIILQRRPPASTIAWLFAFVFLPVVGALVYVLIGPSKLERRRRKRSRARRLVAEGVRGLAALDRARDLHQLALIGIKHGGAPPLVADEVELYFDGKTAYAAIFAAIAGAEHHVHLEYYIWEPDAVGTQLRDALIAKARAGVTVRAIVDGTGSSHLRRAFLAPLRAAGARVEWFNPVRLRTLRRRRADFRSHRKIVVVDGRVGFTGGMNIADCHTIDASPETYWRDTHARVTGAAVWPIQRLFAEDWAFVTEETIDLAHEAFSPAPTAAAPDGDDPRYLVQIVGSGPDGTGYALHRVFFAAINQAQQRLWLTTPYFVPDDVLVSALVTAALRGVDVRVLVPAKGDSKLVDLAAESYFPELLAAGVKIHRYAPRFIHAKTLVADDDVAIVGTCNFDNRSFKLDFELAAVVYGAPINRVLAAAFEADCREAHGLAARELAALPFLHRFGVASARLLSPLL